MIGRRLLHYEILEKLGQGGMGEVWLARDTRLDREVAIKVLSPEVAADPERLERFRREAKAVAALNHPNIVTIHSIEADNDVPFFTMEFVGGTTLSQIIPKEGLGPQRFLDLAIPIADAVSVPVIASGGVGKLEHLAEGIIDGGADAVLAASIFHYGEHTIREAKEYMAGRGIEVRLERRSS